MTSEYRVVLTTTDSKENVSAIVSAVLEQKLAACVQVFPIESHYVWNGEISYSPEFLLFLKAKASDYAALESAISEVHTYEIPEIVCLDIE
ncbi:MAG TPA: divalent-cation tolerance protein CutA, partial [Beijerinckiaceae bacterium]|nr:divalent-cation tolerance protein CutA [Beijerinckiaceae bacterium]